MPDMDVIVLAGGRGRRMGGTHKPLVEVNGTPMLHQVFHLLETADGARVVVVAPETIPVPSGCLRALEDPPFGGPVAGVAAGLQALMPDPAPIVAILASDAPQSPRLLPHLEQALTHDAVVVRAKEKTQPLPALIRTAALDLALKSLITTRDVPLLRLFDAMTVDVIDDPQVFSRDFDTPEQIAEIEARHGGR